MKDETLMYFVLGGVAIYLLTKKSALPVSTIPPGGYATTAPVAAQPAQSLLSNIFTAVATIVPKVISSQQAANNVANGYNADGTIPVTSNTGQDSINQISPGLPGITDPTINPIALQLPTIDTGSENIADETDPNFDFSTLYG